MLEHGLPEHLRLPELAGLHEVERRPLKIRFTHERDLTKCRRPVERRTLEPAVSLEFAAAEVGAARKDQRSEIDVFGEARAGKVGDCKSVAHRAKRRIATRKTAHFKHIL